MDETSPHGETLWYAVSTRSRQEKVAASMLRGLGIHYLLPSTTEVRRWSDRSQAVSRPLFPCYLFVNIEKSCETQLRVLKVPGIVKFVGTQHGPTPIPEKEIDNLRAISAHGLECRSHPFFRAGERVRILRGALAGVEGTLIHSDRGSKLVISIEMIQRSVAINVHGYDIERVVPGRPLFLEGK